MGRIASSIFLSQQVQQKQYYAMKLLRKMKNAAAAKKGIPYSPKPKAINALQKVSKQRHVARQQFGLCPNALRCTSLILLLTTTATTTKGFAIAWRTIINGTSTSWIIKENQTGRY